MSTGIKRTFSEQLKYLAKEIIGSQQKSKSTSLGSSEYFKNQMELAWLHEKLGDTWKIISNKKGASSSQFSNPMAANMAAKAVTKDLSNPQSLDSPPLPENFDIKNLEADENIPWSLTDSISNAESAYNKSQKYWSNILGSNAGEDFLHKNKIGSDSIQFGSWSEPLSRISVDLAELSDIRALTEMTTMSNLFFQSPNILEARQFPDKNPKLKEQRKKITSLRNDVVVRYKRASDYLYSSLMPKLFSSTNTDSSKMPSIPSLEKTESITRDAKSFLNVNDEYDPKIDQGQFLNPGKSDYAPNPRAVSNAELVQSPLKPFEKLGFYLISQADRDDLGKEDFYELTRFEQSQAYKQLLLDAESAFTAGLVLFSKIIDKYCPDLGVIGVVLPPTDGSSITEDPDFDPYGLSVKQIKYDTGKLSPNLDPEVFPSNDSLTTTLTVTDATFSDDQQQQQGTTFPLLTYLSGAHQEIATPLDPKFLTSPEGRDALRKAECELLYGRALARIRLVARRLASEPQHINEPTEDEIEDFPSKDTRKVKIRKLLAERRAHWSLQAHNRNLVISQLDPLLDLERVLLLSPTYAPAYKTRAEYYQGQKIYILAIEDYSQFTKVFKAYYLPRLEATSNPRVVDSLIADTLFQRGNCYLELGDAESALFDFGALVEMGTSLRQVQRAQAHYRRARAKNVLGDYWGSNEDCSTAVSLSGDMYEALKLRADNFDMLGFDLDANRDRQQAEFLERQALFESHHGYSSPTEHVD